MDSLDHFSTPSIKRENDNIIILGETKGHLCQSIYAYEIFEDSKGLPPKVDLLMEKKIGDTVRDLVKKLKIDTVHDISDGGLLIALTEMSVSGNIGFDLNVNQNTLDNGFLFGEDQGRYIISVEDKNLSETIEYIEKNNISYSSIGKSCGNKIIIDKNNEADIEEIRDLYENWFENYLKVN